MLFSCSEWRISPLLNIPLTVSVYPPSLSSCRALHGGFWILAPLYTVEGIPPLLSTSICGILEQTCPLSVSNLMHRMRPCNRHSPEHTPRPRSINAATMVTAWVTPRERSPLTSSKSLEHSLLYIKKKRSATSRNSQCHPRHQASEVVE
jgi:hypothetical protein